MILRQGVGRKYIRMCTCPNWTKAGSTQSCVVCLYKYLIDILHGHCLGILGKDLANVHHAGQYWQVIKLASKLTQRLW